MGDEHGFMRSNQILTIYFKGNKVTKQSNQMQNEKKKQQKRINYEFKVSGQNNQNEPNEFGLFEMVKIATGAKKI